MAELRLKKRTLYRPDGTIFADIDGWRHRWTIFYRLEGETDPHSCITKGQCGGFAYFTDAVSHARGMYRHETETPQ